MNPIERSRREYREFAAVQARGKSPLYEQVCGRIAEDEEMLTFIASLPRERQQPNLLLAAVRFLFGTQPGWRRFRAAVLDNLDAVETVVLTHRTQTNEVGRCAPLVCLLAQLPQPIALLEVGASAGLCLLADRYAYRFGEHRVGDAPLELECAPYGMSLLPDRLPEVVWRMGIDISPLDVTDDETTRWLEALVWPEEDDRLRRLRRAVAIAREDPPTVVAGDMVDALPTAVAAAPRNATLVVFHTAAVTYLRSHRRREFESAVEDVAGVWVSQEAPGVIELSAPGLDVRPVTPAYFICAVDREPRLLMDFHGRWLQSLGHAPA